MRSTMKMEVDTPWANRISLEVYVELENDPNAELVAAAVIRRMIDTMKLMTSELRREGEKTLDGARET